MTHQDLEPDIAERLRELSAALPEPAWDAIDQRLAGAFAAHHATGGGRPAAATPAWRIAAPWRAAAAAVVVLATAITFYPRPVPQPVPPPKPADAPRDRPEPPVVVMRPVDQSGSKLNVETSRPHNRPLNAASGQPGSLAVPDEPSLFADFVALPGASSLPDFESGRIMRIELPLTELPAYGLLMVPDAAQGPIEADLLVGQDGVPRAIRLASSDSH